MDAYLSGESFVFSFVSLFIILRVVIFLYPFMILNLVVSYFSFLLKLLREFTHFLSRKLIIANTIILSTFLRVFVPCLYRKLIPANGIIISTFLMISFIFYPKKLYHRFSFKIYPTLPHHSASNRYQYL